MRFVFLSFPGLDRADFYNRVGHSKVTGLAMNLASAIVQPNIIKGREKCLWILVFAMFRPAVATVRIGLLYSTRVATIPRHN